MAGTQSGARSGPGQTLPGTDPGTDRTADYTERLWVPVGWWLLGALFAVSLLVAVLFYLGPIAAVVAGLLVLAVITPIFLVYGRQQVRVRADRLWVGRANVEWRYVADVRALDPIGTRRRRGPDADARAFLVLRPYLQQAVEVTIRDQADPTPYWLISSRRPARFAAAVRSRAGAGPAGKPPASEPEGSGPPSAGDTLES